MNNWRVVANQKNSGQGLTLSQFSAEGMASTDSNPITIRRPVIKRDVTDSSLTSRFYFPTAWRTLLRSLDGGNRVAANIILQMR
jgi:hypothetical protein